MSSRTHLIDDAGGLPAVQLSHPEGGTVRVYLHGAHVASWAHPAHGELLFLSSRSELREGAAIRGGVPVIFPQFGPGPLPRHGFARTARWTLIEAGAEADGAAVARLALRDGPETRRVWPHAFLAELTVRLSTGLRVELAVRNEGDAPLAFTGALHTYLRVRDVRRAAVDGLGGVAFLDQARGGARGVQDDATLRVEGELDRVYLDVPAELRVRDPDAGRTVLVRAEGFADAVVWNPGPEKARALADLGDDEALRFVCVEAAQVARPVALGPGERWTGAQALRAE